MNILRTVLDDTQTDEAHSFLGNSFCIKDNFSIKTTTSLINKSSQYTSHNLLSESAPAMVTIQVAMITIQVNNERMIT